MKVIAITGILWAIVGYMIGGCTVAAIAGFSAAAFVKILYADY